MDPALVLRTAVLMLVAYLAGSIPVGRPGRAGGGRHGSADDRLRADRRDQRAAGARSAMGGRRRGRRPAQGRPAGPAGALGHGGDPLVEVLCGAAAVAGAIWSVFAGFRSGRGVGTGVGTMLVIQPVAVLLAAPVFIGVILLTRYVSLGSLLGSAAMFPAMLLVLLVVPETPLPYVIYAAVGAALIWLAHADNIDRLLHGTERKFDLGSAGRQAPERLSRRGPTPRNRTTQVG